MRGKTFEEVARQVYIDRLPTWKNSKHKEQWIGTLQTYVFPLTPTPNKGRMHSHDAQHAPNAPDFYAKILRSAVGRSVECMALAAAMGQVPPTRHINMAPEPMVGLRKEREFPSWSGFWRLKLGCDRSRCLWGDYPRTGVLRQHGLATTAVAWIDASLERGRPVAQETLIWLRIKSMQTLRRRAPKFQMVLLHRGDNARMS